MTILTITENEAGQRLDKFLAKYLRQAPKSFLYKMIRKKNITLNGARCSGSELLKLEDQIKLFLSDETIETFSGAAMGTLPDTTSGSGNSGSSAGKKRAPLSVVYEDDHLILINKPSGMLSQKADKKDESLVELLIAYLLETGSLTPETLRTFRPSVCNRLDRNTSGLVIAGKSLPALQILSEAIKERTIGKYYLCIVRGRVTEPMEIRGWLLKDEKSNRVTVYTREFPGTKPIRTKYRPLKTDGNRTLLEVALITGRSHQIRAHLASIGHPIVGDEKYGDPRENEAARKSDGVRSQLLHAWRLVMPPSLAEPLSYLAGKRFEAPMPRTMERMAARMKER